MLFQWTYYTILGTNHRYSDTYIQLPRFLTASTAVTGPRRSSKHSLFVHHIVKIVHSLSTSQCMYTRACTLANVCTHCCCTLTQTCYKTFYWRIYWLIFTVQRTGKKSTKLTLGLLRLVLFTNFCGFSIGRSVDAALIYGAHKHVDR